MGTNTQKKICLVIGDPVAHSLSPAMHNAAYKALNIDSEYEFSAMRVTQNELVKTIEDIRAKGIYALTVTIPHKETIMQYLDEVNDVAEKIGAVNTVVNVNGKLTGYNTDYYGAIESLKRHTSLEGKQIAVLGSGGSARAIVYGLSNKKCKVSIYSRNAENAKELASAFGCEVKEWEQRNATTADVIINTTPLGREGEALPIEENGISKTQVVFDINYNIKGTPLLLAAKRNGATTIDGLEMLLRQGMMQFEICTGLKAPEEAMSNALKNQLKYATAI